MRTMTSLTLTLALSLLPMTALAGHSETHDTGWFEYVYNDDDTEVVRCDALGAISVGDELYVHDRAGPSNGIPPDTQIPLLPPMGAFAGGTWIYQESNGIPGLQVGGFSVTSGMFGVVDYWDPFADECPNSDTLLF